LVLAISGIKIGENFLEISICTQAKKITDPFPWKLTFLAMEIEQYKNPKWAYMPIFKLRDLSKIEHEKLNIPGTLNQFQACSKIKKK
jgi:hypothetical protein